MIRIFLFLSFLFSQIVFSQDCFPEKKKDKRIVKKIERLIDKSAYYDAVDALEEIRGEVIYNVLRSEVLWKRGDFLNAENEALKAVEFCPLSFPKAYYFLGEIAYNRKDYVNSEIYLRQALDLEIKDPYFSDTKMMYTNVKILADIINNPVKFNPEIVQGISTVDDEYLPVISPDQELVFFTRRSDKRSRESIVVTTVEEFVFSQKIDGYFEVGQALDYPFNIEDNEGGASITIDNVTLYYTKCIRDYTGYNNCDIYYVTREDSVYLDVNGESVYVSFWSDANTFSKDISKVDSWESQPTVSSDGKTIIFASDRSGGYGKIDLYEINKIDGNWSAPKNLGPVINSNENEKSPYLHTDGRTLFFSSDNFPSLGGFDIFFSRKDSFGNWKKPVNIGYPINTLSDEHSLFVSTDGKYAYFASNNEDGIGGMDIYSFVLHDDARPERVLFLKGLLQDENDNILQDVSLEIKNITTQEITTVNVDKGTYVASIVLDAADDVLITIKKEGFAFASNFISSEDKSFHYPSSLNFKIQSLEEGKSFNIDNIYFDNNSYDIKYSTKQILIEFAKYLSLNKSLVIEINGFTDNIGGVEKNQLLSENRAKAVRDVILQEGIAEKRVFYNGFGESFPKSSNESEEGRKKNRRTEFRIISQD